MDKKQYFGKAAFALMAFAAAGAVLYALWLDGAFLPGWIAWEEEDLTDMSGTYDVSLADRKVLVRHGKKEIWASPEGVKVQQILSLDIDRDDGDELLLLCWKRGRFGKHKPFWVEEDEKGWSQHLFVYEYAGEKVLPKWMSSYIGLDVLRMSSFGESAGEKRLLFEDRKGEVSSWRWGSWGFSKEDAAPERS